MKSTRLAGMLAAVVLAGVFMGVMRTPARSAENIVVYVRNQPYQGTTLRQNGDIYISLEGLLKALRFGWTVDGNSLTILPQGRAGSSMSGHSFSTYRYRGKTLNIPSIDQGGEPWVSLKGAAEALGAGYQYNPSLGTIDVYFVTAALPAPPPAATPTPEASAPPASASPSAVASSSASPAASGSPSPAASSSASASPEASPSPTPTPPPPDVTITKNQVVPDYSAGVLHAQVSVSNPADVPAKDVNVRVTVQNGDGQQIGSPQYIYVGDMAPKSTADRQVDVSHPDGTSMPRSLYTAKADVTFRR